MSDPITSISRGPRQSNMELLRIIAMMLVMILHADYWTLGAPTALDYHNNFPSACTRTFFESLSIVSVNVFVCISGWFGIKPSIKGLSALLFQIFFIGTIITTACYIINGQSINPNYFRECLALGHYLWFVKAYLGLYILVIPLNYFIKKTSRREFTAVLIAFYVFQTLYGLSGGAEFIQHGYSTFSFIGLYLLARFCRLYLSQYYFKLTILGGIMLGANFTIIVFLQSNRMTTYPFLTYINPANIIIAMSMVVSFSLIKIKPNRLINYTASSAFAVYLIHQSPQIATPYFKPFFLSLYKQFDGIECLLLFALSLIAIYLISILIDQPRKWCWNFCLKHVNFPQLNKPSTY